jgi:hypothetical protein
VELTHPPRALLGWAIDIHAVDKAIVEGAHILTMI